MTTKRLPVVSVIGRPNVGKSTLFNRIIRQPVAIVDDMPGVTRDRNTRPFAWNSRNFLLVDTGGYMASSGDVMEKAIAEQSRLAIEESDLVLFLVDVKSGITDFDSDIAELLRKMNKPVVLGVNKVDGNRDEAEMYEFYNLGIGEPYPVSGKKGRGTGDLLDAIVDNLPDMTALEEEDGPGLLRIAFIGRPNVGKSSIVNGLTGKNSVLVTPVPGTTRDSTDTLLTVEGREVILVDTAGLKKTSKLKESIDYYSSLRTLRSLERADVAAVVIDVEKGLTSYDKRLIDDVEKAGRGLIIVANKWDLIEKDHTTLPHMERELRESLPDKAHYPIVFTSAVTLQRIRNIITTAFQIDEARKMRIPTSEFTEFVRTMPLPPTVGDISIMYATQHSIEPPSFVFFVNDIRKVKDNFVRYVERKMRENFGFFGTPVNITFKGRGRNK